MYSNKFSVCIGLMKFYYFLAFLQFTAIDLEAFLANDNLHINSETQAFEAIQKWVNHNTTERLQHVKSLLCQIRLPLLPKQYLTETVMKHELLKFEGNTNFSMNIDN